MKFDAIIIGSGLGGLECAYLLSKAGMRVLVLEKGTRTGGCIQSYEREGLSFDTGFHYVGGLGEGESSYAAFKALGLLELPWRRLDKAFDRIRIGERDFAFLQGYKDFAENLSAAFPSQRKALTKYTELLRRTGEERFRQLNPKAGPMDFPADAFSVGAWNYLTETFQDSLLINVLSATSLKMELRKESLPLFTFAHGNSGFIESSWRLKGEGSLITEALSEGIRNHGGEIICRAEVVELEERAGKLSLARCANGEVYESDLFVSDVHPALTCGWIKRSDRLRNSYRTRVQRLENSFGMFTVSLRLKPNTLKYFNWNQYIYKRPDVWTFHEEKSSVSGLLISCRIPEDEGEYALQADLLTPMPWSRCERWNQTSVGHRGKEYVEMKERVADECVALAEKVIPGLRDHIERRYISTPLTYRDYTGTPEGSAYGIRKDYREPMMTLLSPRTPIPNLFLTGQNLMLHGIQGVTMTAFFTCAEIVGKEMIWNMLKD